MKFTVNVVQHNENVCSDAHAVLAQKRGLMGERELFEEKRNTGRNTLLCPPI